MRNFKVGGIAAVAILAVAALAAAAPCGSVSVGSWCRWIKDGKYYLKVMHANSGTGSTKVWVTSTPASGPSQSANSGAPSGGNVSGSYQVAAYNSNVSVTIDGTNCRSTFPTQSFSSYPPCP